MWQAAENRIEELNAEERRKIERLAQSGPVWLYSLRYDPALRQYRQGETVLNFSADFAMPCRDAIFENMIGRNGEVTFKLIGPKSSEASRSAGPKPQRFRLWLLRQQASRLPPRPPTTHRRGPCTVQGEPPKNPTPQTRQKLNNRFSHLRDPLYKCSINNTIRKQIMRKVKRVGTTTAVLNAAKRFCRTEARKQCRRLTPVYASFLICLG
jgi:hypothetical protein